MTGQPQLHHSLADVSEAICRMAVEFFGVDHSAVVLFDEDRNAGRVVGEYPDWDTVGVRVPVAGVKVEVELLYEKHPVEILYVQDAVDALGELQREFVRFGIGSFLLVPMLSEPMEGNVIGSFGLDMRQTGHKFSSEQISNAGSLRRWPQRQFRKPNWPDN